VGIVVMSFQVPQNIPSFSSSQRPLEDSYWRASAAKSNGGLGGYGLPKSDNSGSDSVGKLNSFFGGGRDLPMYKDKPYFAPRRTAPTRARRKVLYGIIGLVLITFLWVWLVGWGNARNIRSDTSTGEDLWSWVQSLDSDIEKEAMGSGRIDWEVRREKVRDAFVVSWDAYAQYGWGKWTSTKYDHILTD
jgi:hypothetical protein